MPRTPRALTLLGAILLLAGSGRDAAAQRRVNPDTLRTRPERTGYAETSRYADVMHFLEAIVPTSGRMHLATFGYSYEGRPLPLVVFGDLDAATPEAVLASGRTRVYIQANIHAGEVEGKEALQILLRTLAAGAHREWADSLVLLIAPIYNADGNERITLTNRPLQNGPLGGMGQRPNAQGLDLNRDHMKLESPEARSLALLLQRYDPHVVVDLHTTNGTHHAYHLTYSPPLNPNTDPAITDFLRAEWLPSVTREIRRDYGWDFFHYGNVPDDDEPLERGWYTFDHRPRFNNNYVGLRNRFAILSEAYAYLSFQERILATLRFVEKILDFAHAHATEIQVRVRQAEARHLPGEALALTAAFARAPRDARILLGDVVRDRHPLTGAPLLRRLDVRHQVEMPLYDRFAPDLVEIAPEAYLVPPELERVIELLEAHGIQLTRLTKETALRLERFRVDSTWVAERAFQGHRERSVRGAWEGAAETVPAGTAVVPLNQPLGRLAFYLLEPRSDDGVLNWNLLDPWLERDPTTVPILRTSTSVR